MDACQQSQPNTPYRLARTKSSYETTYKREFSAIKRPSTIEEGAPLGQRFLIGCPYQLKDPVGVASYTVDYAIRENVQRLTLPRPNTTRANRPHPHPQFTHWSRRPDTAFTISYNETEQALRNQLSSTYQTDYIGAPQGFPLPLAYTRSRPFWRQRARRTLDSEHRSAYRFPSATTSARGRYPPESRFPPADAIIPLTLPLWKQIIKPSTYVDDISNKAPSQFYMSHFVDSLNGPMDQ